MTRKRNATDTDEFKRDERRVKAAELYAKGYAQYVIGKLLGYDDSTISRDIAVIRKNWVEAHIKDYDERMLRELTGIEMQESALWEAWHRSCQTEVITTRSHKKQLRDAERPKKGKGKQSTPLEMVVIEENEKTVTRQMIGDPRFMAEITRVRELRCKLMGLLEDAPPSNPVVNIWQQLQEMKFDRDRDEIEEAIQTVRMLPPRPIDDSGLKDSTGYKDVPNKQSLPSGFTDLDDDKSPPSDDTPLDIR